MLEMEPSIDFKTSQVRLFPHSAVKESFIALMRCIGKLTNCALMRSVRHGALRRSGLKPSAEATKEKCGYRGRGAERCQRNLTLSQKLASPRHPIGNQLAVFLQLSARRRFSTNGQARLVCSCRCLVRSFCVLGSTKGMAKVQHMCHDENSGSLADWVMAPLEIITMVRDADFHVDAC